MRCQPFEQDLGVVWALIALMVGLIVGNLTASRPPPGGS